MPESTSRAQSRHNRALAGGIILVVLATGGSIAAHWLLRSPKQGEPGGTNRSSPTHPASNAPIAQTGKGEASSPQPNQPVLPDGIEQPTLPGPSPGPVLAPDIAPAPPTQAETAELLRRHEAAYRKGALSECKALEDRIVLGRPLGAVPLFEESLRRHELFAYRTRLLALCAGSEGALVRDIFLKESDRYAPRRATASWAEGELEFLTALAVSALPELWRATGDRAVLEELLISTPHGDMRLRLLDAIAKLPHEARPALLAAIRRLVDTPVSAEALRHGLLLLFEFSPDHTARQSLMNDARYVKWRPLLLARALESGLLPKDSAVMEAKLLLRTDSGEFARELYSALEAVEPAGMNAIALELMAAQSTPASLRPAIYATLARTGSNQDLDLLVAAANGSNADARAALEALAGAGRNDRVREVFERGASPVAKARALNALATGSERIQWIERGLGGDQPAQVRIAAAALLDATVPVDREKLVGLARADHDPNMRLRSLQELGALGDMALLPFFDDRAGADASLAVRNQAKTYAEELRKRDRPAR